jgi:hypothetical protein
MSDVFSRRGFLKGVAAVGAGLLLPAPVWALDGEFTARIEAFPTPSQLAVRLYLRHGAAGGLVLPAHAIRLDATLVVGDAPVDLVMFAHDRPVMTRGGSFREERPVMLPADREVGYGLFTAEWPRDVRRGAEASLSVQAVLMMPADRHPPEHREAILALARVRSTARVTIPA